MCLARYRFDDDVYRAVITAVSGVSIVFYIRASGARAATFDTMYLFHKSHTSTLKFHFLVRWLPFYLHSRYFCKISKAARDSLI